MSGASVPPPAPPRSTPAQAGPPTSLRGIPTAHLTAGRWYREHGHRASSIDGGCWYYASLPADPTTGGRFDVPAPAGTCYFAKRPLTAALERVGRFTAQHAPVPADLLVDRVVTTVQHAVPAPVARPPDALGLVRADQLVAHHLVHRSVVPP